MKVAMAGRGSHPGHAAVPVVVNDSARHDDEAARLHGGAFTVHSGLRALPFDDKTQRTLGVAVAGRDFARQNDPKPRRQRPGDARLPAQRRVFRDQHPAHLLLSGDQ